MMNSVFGTGVGLILKNPEIAINDFIKLTKWNILKYNLFS
jgi:hypothetical protein